MFTTLKGHFLIATPLLQDPNFIESVVLIADHNDNGTMGLIINSPTNLYLQEIFSQLDIPCDNPNISKQIIFNGGPVDTDCVFVIHDTDTTTEWKSSIQVNENIAVTTSKDILIAIAAGNGPTNSIVTLGYSGWGEGQIEQELSLNSWLNVPICEHTLFKTPANECWQKATELLGISIDQLTTEVGHA